MKNKIKYVLLALFAMLLLCSFISCGTASTETKTGDDTQTQAQAKGATVDILKVGKADCIVINTGDEIIMIDTGEEENFSTVKSYLDKKGYQKIDKLIITHYDKDHIGSAPQIIESYTVGTVYESRFTKGTEEYYAYHTAIAKMGVALVKLQEDFSFESGSCKFEINVPREKKYSTDNDNNTSLVISLMLENRSILFAADAMDERLSEIITECEREYDLVKLPHHGTYLESLPTLIGKIKPSYAVATDSKKNSTDQETLELMNEMGVRLLQTRYGAVHIEISNGEINVSQ